MFNIFKGKKSSIQQEWQTKGAEYARAVNDMLRFADEHGWDNWKGGEPKDERAHLARKVISLLRKANEQGETQQFRQDFPPAHDPLVDLIDDEAQSICQLQFIGDEKIVFLTGAPYQQRQAYLLNGNELLELDEGIRAIGKSKMGDVFAICVKDRITTTRGWQGEIIAEFIFGEDANHGITELTPFNDGKRILLTSAKGIFILSEQGAQMIHPVVDEDDEEWAADIDMENAVIADDNSFIVTADQASDFRVLDAKGEQIGVIGPQSSYPHFCLFSKDNRQLLTNSCHFYNGISIGVATGELDGMLIPAYQEEGDFTLLDDQMRVYAGVATSGAYILGDAYGYIRAIDLEGNTIWKHHLGSTISGMTISADEQTLWVGSYSGMLHKLKLGAGQDAHTVGNGNHKEQFRIIFWKSEAKPLFW